MRAPFVPEAKGSLLSGGRNEEQKRGVFASFPLPKAGLRRKGKMREEATNNWAQA
jgi:hypothetical protein